MMNSPFICDGDELLSQPGWTGNAIDMSFETDLLEHDGNLCNYHIRAVECDVVPAQDSMLFVLLFIH